MELCSLTHPVAETAPIKGKNQEFEMTRTQSAVRIALLVGTLAAIVVLVPVGVMTYLTYRAEQNIRKAADELELSLQTTFNEWEMGHKREFESNWPAVWTRSTALLLPLARERSVTARTERHIVNVLNSREAKLYFSAPQVREEFATSWNVAAIRDAVAQSTAPPHMKRIWATVETRLAEPPTPWPQPGSKKGGHYHY